MNNIAELKLKNFSWINAAETGKARMDFLAKKYNLLEEDILDVLPPTQTSKLVEREDYLFIILLFPIYDREEKCIRTEEINFFIAKNFLITPHDNKITIMKTIFDYCQKNK